jgi:hypothetical protein
MQYCVIFSDNREILTKSEHQAKIRTGHLQNATITSTCSALQMIQAYMKGAYLQKRWRKRDIKTPLNEGPALKPIQNNEQTYRYPICKHLNIEFSGKKKNRQAPKQMTVGIF